MSLKAVFFDFDGTLVDSEIFFRDFWIEACKDNGFDLSNEEELYLRSLDHQLTEEYFHKLFGPSASYEKIYESRDRIRNETFKTKRFGLKEGALEALRFLHDELNIPCYVVSSSSLDYVIEHSTRLGIKDYFTDIISVRGEKRGKPFPYVYLRALEKAHLNKDEVIVIEDSPNGVRSAYNAGIRTIFVKDLSEADDEIREKSIYQLDNLNQLIDVLKKEI